MIDIDPFGFTHAAATMTDETDTAEAPLCFVGEAKRTGATAAEVNLTFDQALDIEDFPTEIDRSLVSCPDCREWLGA